MKPAGSSGDQLISEVDPGWTTRLTGKYSGAAKPLPPSTSVQFTVTAWVPVFSSPIPMKVLCGCAENTPSRPQVMKADDVPSFCTASGRLRMTPSNTGSADWHAATAIVSSVREIGAAMAALHANAVARVASASCDDFMSFPSGCDGQGPIVIRVNAFSGARRPAQRPVGLIE